MLLVYLDQFAWIGLARAAHGRRDGARYRDALETCRATRAHEVASFPLDLYRYWETAKNHNEGSRTRLVDTMIELSDFDAIITPKQLLLYEIDIALRAHFGRPNDVTAPRVFRRGIAHLRCRRRPQIHEADRPTDGLRRQEQRPPNSDRPPARRATAARRSKRSRTRGPTTRLSQLG